MGKSFALALVLVLLTASYAVIAGAVWASPADSWVSKMSMQVARGGLGVAVVDGKIYALGGYSGSGPYLNTNEEYDPVADTWAFKASMPTPMAFFGVAVYQNKIYCISSENGSNDVYDPATDTWETKASLPNPREGITANVVDSKIHIIGGEANTTDIYDPTTDSWISKAPMLVKSSLNWGWSCTSVVVDCKIHVIGATPFSNSHQIYDPFIDSWTLGKQLIAGYWFATAGATTGQNSPERIYVYGGDRRWWPSGVVNFTSQSYDPKTDIWTSCESMPTGRLNAGVAVVNDILYAIGGFVPWLGDNWSASEVNEQYTPIGYKASDQPSPSPTASPTPTQSPEPQQIEISSITCLAIALVIVTVVGTGLLAYFRKRNR